MRGKPIATTPQPSLSPEMRKRLAPDVRSEQQLGWLLARLNPAERRAFWLAALIIDQAVTLAAAVDWWRSQHPDPPPTTKIDPPPVVQHPERKRCVCGQQVHQPPRGRPWATCGAPACQRTVYGHVKYPTAAANG
jgi:hypothetical protein